MSSEVRGQSCESHSVGLIVLKLLSSEQLWESEANFCSL